MGYGWNPIGFANYDAAVMIFLILWVLFCMLIEEEELWGMWVMSLSAYIVGRVVLVLFLGFFTG